MASANSSQKKQIITVVAALIVLLGASTFIYSRLFSGPRRQPGNTFFYDLTSGELFNADEQPAPIAAPSGGEGALAHVFACGDCADPAQRFTAYIEKFDDAAKAQLDKDAPNIDALESGHFVAEPSTSPKWVTFSSAQGAAIREAPFRKCESPSPCKP